MAVNAEALAAGFDFEPDDPSVGIQGGWIHVCRFDMDGIHDDSIDVEDQHVRVRYEGEGANRRSVWGVDLLCNECGVGTHFTETEWDPDVPEDVEDEHHHTSWDDLTGRG